jgi:hypothetical protein
VVGYQFVKEMVLVLVMEMVMEMVKVKVKVMDWTHLLILSVLQQHLSLNCLRDHS